MINLPAYVTTDSDNSDVLLMQGEAITFPLSPENQNILAILEKKFDQEKTCSGLAAPQLGFPKRMIVFAVKDDPELRKWRPDLSDTMPKTIWINPTYEPIGEETHVDYEACFSVEGFAGQVARFKTIRYIAYTPDGEKVTGVAHGFLARVMQHEIDHIHGKLYTDYVPKEELMPVEVYREMRAKAIESLA